MLVHQRVHLRFPAEEVDPRRTGRCSHVHFGRGCLWPSTYRRRASLDGGDDGRMACRWSGGCGCLWGRRRAHGGPSWWWCLMPGTLWEPHGATDCWTLFNIYRLWNVVEYTAYKYTYIYVVYTISYPLLRVIQHIHIHIPTSFCVRIRSRLHNEIVNPRFYTVGTVGR